MIQMILTLAKQHDLEFLNIFADDGQISSNSGLEFEGTQGFKAREAVSQAVQKNLPNW